MYTIEVNLKGTPIMLSVQRKESDAAAALYKSIVATIQAKTPSLVELTCDRDTAKKIGILSNEITAVQLSDKAGGTATGRTAGFFNELAQ